MTEKPTSAPGYSEDKKNYLTRMNRIAGQVNGVASMIEDDRYCIDILTQISAINSALENVALKLMEEHMHHCVQDVVKQGDDATIEEKLDELTTVVSRMVKS